MKASTTSTLNTFKPLVFTFTIETEEELAEMYARMNMPIARARDHAHSKYRMSSQYSTQANTTPLFTEIERAVNDQIKLK